MPAGSPMRRVVGRLLRDTAYVLVTFPVTLGAVIVCTTLFALGAGLVVIWVGLPILVAAHWAGARFAEVERRLVPWVLPSRRPVEPTTYPGDVGMLRPLTDGRSWAQLLHGLFGWIPSTVSFTVVVTWWATAFGALVYPAWSWALPDGDDDEQLHELMGLSDTLAAELLVYVGGGIVLLILLPWVVRVFALMQAWITTAMLGSAPDEST